MKNFSAGEITVFLKAIDSELTQPFRLIIIGGSAASLVYGVTTYTHDIDTFNTTNFEIIDEISKSVRKKTGLNIPIQEVTISDAPYHFEERLIEEKSFNFKKLSLLFPEKHDLVLIKLLRGDAHDFQHISEIHSQYPLEYDILLKRLLTEMDHVICNPAHLKIKFLYMTEILFGEKKAEETENYINRGSNWLVP